MQQEFILANRNNTGISNKDAATMTISNTLFRKARIQFGCGEFKFTKLTPGKVETLSGEIVDAPTAISVEAFRK